MRDDAPERGSTPPGFIEPTFGQRLVARLIDAVVMLPVILLIGVLTEGRVGRALGVGLAAVYELTLTVRRGQTLGKMAMGTRIVDLRSGSLPSMQQVVARWLTLIGGSLVALAVPAIEPFDAVYTLVVVALVLRPPLHRGLHDLVASTVVSSVRPIGPAH